MPLPVDRCLLAICASLFCALATAQTLEEKLLSESAASLAADARSAGDPARGAIVFYQPFMSCRKCHDAEDAQQQLGPDLSKWDTKATDEQLVDAVLRPSASIRDGYDSLTVLTEDGQSVVGLIVENDQRVTLRDPSQPGKLYHFQREQLDAVVKNKNSLMPAALVNQLTSRQQFLDLIGYLIKIRDGGPLVARNLAPAPHLYAVRPLPEYENSIDHAGMIAELDRDSFERGAAIYSRLCVNCHGTHDQPGSLPTSLRFASGQFKNGNDPYSMYQTLTRGFGMMQPQSWMVPQQKYDVIHYIRQAYLKEHNRSQFYSIDRQWLASLPKGDSRGPSPRESDSWVTMDYGRSLINTYEIGDDGTNFAYKGIAVRLDDGPGGVSRGRHWFLFDHDTMRMAAAWSGEGFIDWKGIHFNGQHAIHPRIVGHIHAETKTGPGWADPDTGSFDDPRLVGRDDRHYGPLPRGWAEYLGLHAHGNQTVIRYRVGDTDILESPRLLSDTPLPIYARQLEIGPRSSRLTMQVATVDREASRLTQQSPTTVIVGPDSNPVRDAASQRLDFDGSAYAQINSAADLEMTGQSFTLTARLKTTEGGTLLAKTAAGPQWVPDGKAWFIRNGRLCFDIGWVGVVQSKTRIADNRWHNVALTWNHSTGMASLFIDGKADASKMLKPKARHDNHILRIGFAAPDFPSPHSFFVGQIESIQFYAEELSRQQLSGLKKRPRPLADWDLIKADSIVANRVADEHQAVVKRGEPISTEMPPYLIAGVHGQTDALQWTMQEGRLCLTFPAGQDSRSVSVWLAAGESPQAVLEAAASLDTVSEDAASLAELTSGGPARYPEVIATAPVLGRDTGPLAVDVLTRPATNPWLARVRLTGFDFFSAGDSAAVCSWDGDVWLVTGIDSVGSQLTWKRIASGLFQPLGVRIVDDVIYVTCRDQLVILRDRNGDGETDFFECFNNDHQVTDHFHEFAMGLQTDEDGNFYYAKSARHALAAIVPHHGTLLRVSQDGKRTEILANGFRAANGVCLNPDGTFIVTDQEGHWNPKNRINWVRKGGFYGNMFGYHDVTDSSDAAMQQPLCWITNDFDRSPAELLWVPDDCWGPLGGSLLNLSYGYGKVFVVPHEQIDGQMQGGMCELPLPQFPTGLVRGRFHPTNGHLYTCGMFAWAGNQQQPGGFYRIRYTGKPMQVPTRLEAKQGRVVLGLTDSVSQESAENPDNYAVSAWDLKRTANYGSKHFNQRSWQVQQASLSADGKTITLQIPELAPTWGMEIRCFWKTPDGQSIERRIHNTIHNLGK